MKLCEFAAATPAENLACDEALLDLCEEGCADEILRLWEPASYFVVVGYANRVATEVNLEFCQKRAIPVLRRCTGGGTVLQGPGCLNYSLILHMEDTGVHRSIPATNRFILHRHQAVLSQLLGKAVQLQGQTDLALDGRKFSGNSQRRRKHFLLFHGSFLLHLDLALLEKALPSPSKEPAYRAGRPHADFLMNLGMPPERLKRALASAWHATEPLNGLSLERVALLAREKYSTAEWNLKF